LSVSKKFINTIFARARVVIEHTISGVKRCRMVQEVLRRTQEGISDRVMEMACGLRNLRISCRHPLPAFDLLNFFGST
jgi:hypothetical protein